MQIPIGETEVTQYTASSTLSQGHTPLRWLVEVFFEDWKLYEGWAKEAKQLDEEGSRRGLIQSLLLDYALILHPKQMTRIKNYPRIPLVAY